MNADGGGQRRLASGWPSAWSPDSQRIAFVRGSPGVADAEIYVVNADGSGQRRLTHNTVNEGHATRSRTGRRSSSSERAPRLARQAPRHLRDERRRQRTAQAHARPWRSLVARRNEDLLRESPRRQRRDLRDERRRERAAEPVTEPALERQWARLVARAVEVARTFCAATQEGDHPLRGPACCPECARRVRTRHSRERCVASRSAPRRASLLAEELQVPGDREGRESQGLVQGACRVVTGIASVPTAAISIPHRRMCSRACSVSREATPRRR